MTTAQLLGALLIPVAVLVLGIGSMTRHGRAAAIVAVVLAGIAVLLLLAAAL